MHCLIEYVLHFQFYQIWTLLCICICVVFTYIVLLSQGQCMLIWGLEQCWWCLEKTHCLAPSCRVGSHTAHRNNFESRHCLFSSFAIHLCSAEITVCGHCCTVSCKVIFAFCNTNPSNTPSKSASSCLEVRCMNLGWEVILHYDVV